MTKSSRRDFIKQTSILSAGYLLSCNNNSTTAKAVDKRIGLGLYTVRDQLSKDLDGSLAKIAEIGYGKVETINYQDRKFFGLAPKQFADLLAKHNLDTPSGHFGLKGFLHENNDDEWKWAIEDAKVLGQKYMVIPWLDKDYRDSLDDYKKLAPRLNRAGELCKNAGIQFAYHNHEFEFQSFDGQTGMDVFVNETDPALVKFELDLYWISFASKNPVEFINAHPGMFPLWHVKDMARSADRGITEVGNGQVNFKEIFNVKSTAGLDHLFIEQDNATSLADPFGAVTKSFAHVKQLLG